MMEIELHPPEIHRPAERRNEHLIRRFIANSLKPIDSIVFVPVDTAHERPETLRHLNEISEYTVLKIQESNRQSELYPMLQRKLAALGLPDKWLLAA